MVIYSVFITIDKQVAQDWLAWMRTVHIPEVMQHEGFKQYVMIKIDSPELCQYRIDYYIESMDFFVEYQEKYAPELQKKHTERYQGKFTAHRTIGSVI